jgi:hypothetical protein
LIVAGLDSYKTAVLNVVMSNTFVGGVYLVAVTSAGPERGRWVVASAPDDAVATVLKQLPGGCAAKLLDRRLTPQEMVGLKLRPGEACKYAKSS